MALNLPNTITAIRIALIPAFVWLFFADIPYRNWTLAGFFVLLALSDFFDGYLARKHKTVTNAGKLLDPIADKLLILTPLFLLVGTNVPLWMALTIAVREIGLTAIRLIILRREIVVAASFFGKSKTTLQIISITGALLELPGTGMVVYLLLLIATLVTVLSGLDYLIKIRTKLQKD